MDVQPEQTLGDPVANTNSTDPDRTPAPELFNAFMVSGQIKI